MAPLTSGSACHQHHLFLASGTSLMQARQQVAHFMKTTQLVVYQSLIINDEKIISAKCNQFWMQLTQGIEANRRFCRALLQELQNSDVNAVQDLLLLPLGYPSKILHLLSHMLDGFFGIDSVFYNLLEDSHWLSETLRTTIHQQPDDYWLVPLGHGPLTKSLLHL